MKTCHIVRIALFTASISLLCLSAKAQYNFKKLEHGCYYDTAGVKHIGIIHFRVGDEIKRIDFQTDSLSKSQKINIEDIKAVVVTHRPVPEDTNWGISAKDSLVVIQWRKDKYLAKYVTTLQSIKIFGHVFSSQSGPLNNPSYYTAVHYDFVENNAILDYHDDESINWKEFYSRKFSKYPDVVQAIRQIKSKDPSLEDKATIVRYITHHYPLQ